MPDLLGENHLQRTCSIPRSLASGNVLVTNKRVSPPGQPQTALESLFWSAPHPGQPQSAPDSGQQYYTQRGGYRNPATGSSPSVTDYSNLNQPAISSPTYTGTSAPTLVPSIAYATQFCVSKAPQPSTSSTVQPSTSSTAPNSSSQHPPRYNPNSSSQSSSSAPASFNANTFSEFLVSSGQPLTTGRAPKVERGFKTGKYTTEDVQLVESILFPSGKPCNWNRQTVTARYVTAEKTNRIAVSATMSHNGICANCYCGGITPPPAHSVNECRAQNNPCQLVCPKCPGRYHWLKDCPRQNKSEYYKYKAGKAIRKPVKSQPPRRRSQPSAHQQIKATRPGNSSKH